MDHTPELVSSLRLIVVGHRKLRAEEKITNRILMKDAVD
jgi:hypothetical protein